MSDKYTKFATELWDGFESLKKHTDNQISFVKDLLKFFKKRSEIEEDYAKSLAKLSKSNLSTIGTLQRTCDDLLTETLDTSNIHGEIVSQLSEKVIDAVQGLIKDMESTRKQLVNDGSALNSAYKNNVENLQKAKKAYESACKEAELARKTFDTVKNDPSKVKDLPKLDKESKKRDETKAAADDAYKKKVEETNNFLEQYYTEKMPRIMSEFEHLESVRIHMLKANLKKFIQVLEVSPPLVLKELKSFLDTVEKINNEADIDMYVKQYKTGNEIPEPFEYEPYVEGSDAKITKKIEKLENKQKSRFQKIKSNSMVSAPPPSPRVERLPPADQVFGVPIEKILDKQRDKYPELEVPRILTVLSDAIFKMEGTKTEGIFRVPAFAEEVKSTREKFDDGNYDVIYKTANVHTPCALMKLWFRELPEPLIPDKFYETSTETPDKALEIYSQIPQSNQKIITFLVSFIHQLLAPEIVEVTKMNKDNLAMVFAPSVLRCPYADARALSAADKEKSFVLKLIDNITPVAPKSAHWTSVTPSAPREPLGGTIIELEEKSMDQAQVEAVKHEAPAKQPVGPLSGQSRAPSGTRKLPTPGERSSKIQHDTSK